MKYVIISHTGDKIIITCDTHGELLDAKTGQVMGRLRTCEGLFYSPKHRVAISMIGRTVIAEMLFESLMKEFISKLECIDRHFTIKDLQTEFYQHFKKLGPVPFESILKYQHIIFVHISDNGVFIDRLHFTSNDGLLQRVETNVIQLEANMKLVFADKGAMIRTMAEEDALLMRNLLQINDNPIPMATLTLKTDGNLQDYIRTYRAHNFVHLDDLLVASEHGRFGIELLQPYSYRDLAKLTTIGDTFLDKNPNYKRLLTFAQYVRLCRSRVDKTDIQFDNVYLRIYHFINSVARENTLFAFKLQKVIEFNVMFMIELTNDNSHANAYYSVSLNMIVFNANILGRMPQRFQTRIFCHEIEHAFQVCLHHQRWSREPVYDTIHVTNTTRYSHGLPFYPYTQNESDKFMEFISLGFRRVKKLHQLLQLNQQQLSFQQNEYLELYREVASQYDPHMWFETKEYPRQFDLDAINGGITNMNGLECEFVIFSKRVLKHDNNVQHVELCHYYNLPVIALVFDLLLQLDVHSKDLSELQARTVGELPLDILALLFPELLKYQAEDIRMVFEDMPAILEQAAARYDSSFHSKLFQEPSVPTQQLLRGIIADETLHETLLKKFEAIVSKSKTPDFYTVFQVPFSQKNYSQALRRLCTIENKVTLELLELLLSHKEALRINVNETANGKCALFFAATKAGRRTYEILVTHRADETFSVNNQSMSELLEIHFPKSASLNDCRK